MTTEERVTLIRQIGEYCTNTLCKNCFIKKSDWHTKCHNSCVECFRFPDVAEQIAKATRWIRMEDYK